MNDPTIGNQAPFLDRDAGDFGFFTLRDGTTAQVRIAAIEDREGFCDFFQRLSPESRQRRFCSSSLPSPELIATLCDSCDPRSRLTLVVTRLYNGDHHIVATGSYFAKDAKTAEVAFAVDDALQGNGLGTLLLERLALLAVRYGFGQFWALTRGDNQSMLEVFRESGFPFEERLDRGEVEVDLTIGPTEAGLARQEARHRVATAASLRPFFH